MLRWLFRTELTRRSWVDFLLSSFDIVLLPCSRLSRYGSVGGWKWMTRMGTALCHQVVVPAIVGKIDPRRPSLSDCISFGVVGSRHHPTDIVGEG